MGDLRTGDRLVVGLPLFGPYSFAWRRWGVHYLGKCGGKESIKRAESYVCILLNRTRKDREVGLV